MKKHVKKAVIAILALVLVISLFGAANHLANYIRADEAYDLAKEIAHTPEFGLPETTATPPTKITADADEIALDTDADYVGAETQPESDPEPQIDEFAMELLKTDIDALRRVNPDVIGWICIPGTSISYPLIQGDDNSRYLDYSWEGMRNRVGSIYLDYRSSADFSDFHSIIYGHRMYIDAMFNALKKYNDPEFLSAHPSVYVLIDGQVLKYDVFSAYNAEASGPSWRLGLGDVEGQQALFNFCLGKSEVEAGVSPSAEAGDKLLTLSTCSQSGDSRFRWVVHSVQSGIFTVDDASE